MAAHLIDDAPRESGVVHEECDELNIGEKVRQLRRTRGISLQQLSRETGMSYSYLSALENGKHSISVTNLQRLARYFEVDLIYFLENRLQAPVRIGREEFGPMEGEPRLHVVTSRTNKALQVSYVTLPPHSLSEHHLHHHDEGEEYILVLSGEAVVEIDGQRYDLGERDAVCFPSHSEHVVYTEQSAAQMILVAGPPYGRFEHEEIHPMAGGDLLEK